MTINQQEFETVLADDTKEIAQDLAWAEDEDHSPAREFRRNFTSKIGVCSCK